MDVECSRHELTFTPVFRVRVVFALLAVAILALNTLSVLAEEKDGSGSIDILSLLQKLPTFIPFIAMKVESTDCKKKLNDFRTELTQATETAGQSKATLPMMKEALCKVPNTCTQEVVGALKKMVQTGGMVEKMAKSFLDQKGIDLETADVLLLAYVESLCDGTLPLSDEL